MGLSSKMSALPRKILGIEFAPFDVPLERRLQTLTILSWVLFFIVFPVIVYPLIFYLIFFSNYGTSTALITVPYLTWMWLFDMETPHKGGRKWDYVRSWNVWKRYNEYFPIKLVKTAELDPKRNYLFCGHPHGLLCTGIFGSFATHRNQAQELFPGMEFSVLTFDASFMFPLLRELGLAMGCCSASRRSMDHNLSQPGGGRVSILIPGGAPEALDFHPGSYVIQLKKRKGFIKVALQNGSPLVPVFSFGETEIFDQVPNPRGSIVRTIQDKIQQMVMIPPILFFGRGIFQYSFGFLPRRQPLTVVVGAPIPVNKTPEPTNKEIDELHQKYTKAVTDLFYSHRDKYALDPSHVLTIV